MTHYDKVHLLRMRFVTNEVCNAAADEIEQLREQLADAESDVDTIAAHNIEIQEQLAAAQARIAAIEEERDERPCAAHYDELLNKLTASQAREQQLRESGKALVKVMSGTQAETDFAFQMLMLEEALALPTDTSALDQIKASYEAQIQQLRDSFENYIRSMNMVDAKQALAIHTDTSAIEAIVARAGEVMRERCGTTMFELYDGAEGAFITETIRALPGVTLEDLK